MSRSAKSLRPFIGASDYNLSRAFYAALKFDEFVISPDMSLFKVNESLAFYLQEAYVKDWIDNTMLFLEVDNLDEHHAWLVACDLPGRFAGVRVSPIRSEDWGREYFVHDPSGVLWHIGQFSE